MQLVLPDVSITVGPTWATMLNTAYTLIDSHNHSSGQGVQITPSGLNISSDLTFAQNNATNLRSARLYNNSSFTAGANDLTCLYALNNELYYRDGAGNTVQITLNGVIDISGTISNLTVKDANFTVEYFGDITRQFRFSAANIPASTTITLIVPSASDTLAGIAATQNLTNKTLGSTNTLTGSVLASFSPDGTNTITAPSGITDTIVLLTATQALTNKSLTAPAISGAGTITTGMSIVDKTDSTKQIQITLGGQTTGKTLTLAAQQTNSETLSIPNITSNDTIAVLSLAQTLINKTLGATSIQSASALSFYNSGNTYYTSLQAGANTANYTATLPISDGTGGQFLTTNGSGQWGWGTAASTVGNVAANDSNVTFTNSSNRHQISTPTANRTHTLPTTSIVAGDTWTFENKATAYSIQMQSSGANNVFLIDPLQSVTLVALVNTPTTAANWGVQGISANVVYGNALGVSPIAGTVGEVVLSEISSYTSTTTTGAVGDLTSISLTPGNWMISGLVQFGSQSGTYTSSIMGITTTSGNSQTGLVDGITGYTAGPIPTSNYNIPIVFPPRYYNVTTSTTYYLKYGMTFTGTAAKAVGRIQASRVS